MKKLILSLTAAFIAVSALSGCAANKEPDKEDVAIESIKVTDVLGREVEVPSDVKSIVALGAGGLRMICYAQVEDYVVGVEEGEYKKTLAKGYNYVNFDKFENLPNIGQGGSGSYVPYEEEIVSLNPDVIFASYPSDQADDLAKKTGIPVVVITYDTGMFDPKLYESMLLIGEIMDASQRCEEVVSYLKAMEADLIERTSDIALEDKPSVYTGACSFKGSHGIEGTYTQFPPFTAIGANNVADELSDQTGGVVIDIEKLLVWDPDIIFLDPHNMHLVNEDYANNKEFYHSLKAVANGEIYTQVAYNWYTANIETAVIDAYYAGKVMFSDRFSDIEIEKLANEVYTFMLGDNAKNYYSDMVEGGLGFRKLTIGE